MPPKKDARKPLNAKIGMQLRDVIPTSISQPPREGKQVKLPTTFDSKQQQIFQPFDQIELWPGDEVAQNQNYGLESKEPFRENFKYEIPKSFIQVSTQITFWRRPKEYLYNLIDEDKLESQGDAKQKASNFTQMKKKLKSFNPTSKKSMFSQVRKDSNDSSNSKKETPNRRNLFRKQKTVVISQKPQAKTFLAKYSDDYETGIMSPLKRSPEKLQQINENEEHTKVKIFNTVERDETELEKEERKKQEEINKAKAAKDKKKAAPKVQGENGEEEIQKVTEVRLSNIDMKGNIPAYSKWIGAQLQIIKDRKIKDANTEKAIWSKIYPQQNGIPVYNPSGKYWVKLYFMGKERKIEIDDRMPTNVKKNCLFVQSTNIFELWTVLFSKAILKLQQLSQNFTLLDNEVGDGSVMYALTGHFPETLSLKRMTPNAYKYIQELLSDNHFKKETNYMICYCNADHKPSAPSNQIANMIEAWKDGNSPTFPKKTEEEESPEAKQQFMRSSGHRTKTQIYTQSCRFSLTPSLVDMKRNQEQEEQEEKKKDSQKIAKPQLKLITNFIDKIKEKPTYVIPGFAYSIMEAFYNENFNMIFTKERSQQEKEYRAEYARLQKQNVHNMTKEQKLEFRKQRKQIFNYIREEDRKRDQLQKIKQPIQYKLFKVKTECRGVALLQFKTPFDKKEIYIGQKCILNRLSKPPNYEQPDLRIDDDRSIVSQNFMAGNNDFQIKPLDDFLNPNALEPMKRGQGGFWVLDTDLGSAFQYILIYHNFTKLPFNQTFLSTPNPETFFTNSDQFQVIVIERNEINETSNQISQSNQSHDLSLQDELSEDKDYPLYSQNQSNLMICFQANQSKAKKIIPNAYCILSNFDFDNFEQIEIIDATNRQMNTFHHFFENDDAVFKLDIFSPLQYQLQISSTNQFKLMSISQYLQEKIHFEQKIFTIEYRPIEQQRYQIFQKFKISEQDISTLLVFNINSLDNCTNISLLQNIRLKFQEIEAGTDINLMNTEKEGVQQNISENIFTNLEQYNKFQLQENKNYIVTLEGVPQQNYNQGQFNLQVLFKNERNELNMDIIELVDPSEYSDKYYPTKYGIIFRERLFFGASLNASFQLRMVKNSNDNEAQALLQKSPVKGKKNNNLGQQLDIIEEPLTSNRLIKLEIMKEDKVIAYDYGHNQALLSNILLLFSKNENEELDNYYLQASFDLRDWPECKTVNEDTKGIYWILRTFTSDTLAIVRDTQKEDYEAKLKKGWEDKEPGRAEKAKKSRQKFLIKQKKERNEELTPEEEEILNEPRLSKKQREEQQQQQGGFGKGKQQQSRRPGQKQQPIKKQQQEEECQVQQVVKEYPKALDSQTKEIIEFLAHMEQPRHFIENPEEGQEGDIRTDENKKEIEEQHQLYMEEITQTSLRNKERWELILNKQQELKETIENQCQQINKQFEQDYEKLIEERKVLSEKILEDKSKENSLRQLCLSEKPTIEELEKQISEVEQLKNVDKELIDISKKLLANAKVNALTEKLNNGTSQFILEDIQEALEEIDKWSIAISEELRQTAQSIIQQANENPTFIATKQAELKKIKKPPQKRK